MIKHAQRANSPSYQFHLIILCSTRDLCLTVTSPSENLPLITQRPFYQDRSDEIDCELEAYLIELIFFIISSYNLISLL